MAKYASIPWSFDRFRQIVDGNGQIVYVGNFTFGSHSDEETKANTKRIIACVNACDGFAICELEGAELYKDSIKAQAEISELRKQRDELVSALIGLLGDAEAIARVMPAYGESLKLKNARAAINKIGGEV